MSARRLQQRRFARGGRTPAGEREDRVSWGSPSVSRWARCAALTGDSYESESNIFLLDSARLEVRLQNDSETKTIRVGERMTIRGGTWVVRQVEAPPPHVSQDVVLGVEYVT